MDYPEKGLSNIQNALNGDCSHIYISQIMIQQKLDMLTKCLKVN